MTDDSATARTAKPTLKTISQLSGLAVPTVSRALNDAPDIGSDTKKRVRKIADEIGYIPNRAGVRLRTGRTNVVSLIMSTDHNNHTGRLIATVSGGLDGSPFHLIVTPSFPADDPMKPVRYIVETGSADAIILNQIAPEDPRVAYLMERGFPFVTHGRSNWSDKHAFYDFDNRGYGVRAVQGLHDRGRKSVLLLGPPLHHSYGNHMLEGVRETALALGMQFERTTNIDSDTPSLAAAPVLASYLEEYPETDAIITGSTNAAIAAVGAIEQLGRTLGKDIDVYTKESEPYLTLMRPELLAIYEDIDETGDFLAKAALQAIRQPSALPMQKLDLP